MSDEPHKRLIEQTMAIPPRRKPGRPRTRPRPEEAQVQTPPAASRTPLVSPGDAADWVDYSGEHLELMKVEIPWALRDMFGMPEGLVSQGFLQQAKEVLVRHYPNLRKSSMRRTMEKGTEYFPCFVCVSVEHRKQFDRNLRFCDLLETMMADGAPTRNV